MPNPRQIALDCLIRWDRENSYPNLLLSQKLTALQEERDRSFCTRLVYGTIERKITLDFYISEVSSVAFRKIHIVTRNILRMGLYQILYMNVPANAACNTAVELAKKNGQIKSAGFVNAVLRKLSTGYQNISLPSDNEEQMLSIRYSVDVSIVRLLIKQYGSDFVCAYFEAIAKQDTQTSVLAVNTIKTDFERAAALLEEEGVRVLSKTENLLTVSFTGNPEALTAYRQGWVHFIGKVSYEAVNKLDVRPGQTVIDCCSAPGGKTFAIAYKMKNQGKIYAIDLYEHKINLMRKEAARLGITNIEFLCADAQKVLPQYIKRADRVLCDVPCSGLGIILKKPDIRYKDMNRFSLQKTQADILKAGVEYLKPDGKLVYSTCTVNQEENRLLIEQNRSIKIVSDRLYLPQNDYTDGFYIAEIRKND